MQRIETRTFSRSSTTRGARMSAQAVFARTVATLGRAQKSVRSGSGCTLPFGQRTCTQGIKERSKTVNDQELIGARPSAVPQGRARDALWWLLANAFLVSLMSGPAALAQGSQVPFVTVAQGPSSGIRTHLFAAITTEAEWEALWRRHRSATSAAEAPAIDFRQIMLVAVFAGEKRTGGYGLEITHIEADASRQRLQVFVRETFPPAQGIVTQALTQPYHIVQLTKVDWPVVFLATSAAAPR